MPAGRAARKVPPHCVTPYRLAVRRADSPACLDAYRATA